jgi:hypothetical protein
MNVTMTVCLTEPQALWAEFKYSGVGREFGTFGVERFLNLGLL